MRANPVHKTSYGLLIDTAPYVLLLMRTNPLQEQVGWGLALEIETFWGPVKCIDQSGECQGTQRNAIP
jgi:hypothetical protein